MAEAESQATEAYLLTGFSPLLDWRPIQFSKPIPRPLICDLCGVVSLKPVFPGGCPHWYCETCYRHVLRDDPPQCPLDRREVSTDGLAKNTLNVDLKNLLTEAGMRCPNSAHGCGYVLTKVSEKDDGSKRRCPPPLFHLESHYASCKFNEVSCEACGAPVVSGKIVEHIKNNCVILEPQTLTSPKTKRARR